MTRPGWLVFALELEVAEVALRLVVVFVSDTTGGLGPEPFGFGFGPPSGFFAEVGRDLARDFCCFKAVVGDRAILFEGDCLVVLDRARGTCLAADLGRLVPDRTKVFLGAEFGRLGCGEAGGLVVLGAGDLARVVRVFTDARAEAARAVAGEVDAACFLTVRFLAVVLLGTLADVGRTDFRGFVPRAVVGVFEMAFVCATGAP